jgi:hypothetical protein
MSIVIWVGSRLKSFGMFWKDFLIGDNPEFLIGAILIMAIAFTIRSSTTAASIIMPAAVITLLVYGVRLSERRPPKPDASAPPESLTNLEK